MSKEIPVYNNNIAIVDDNDYAYLSQWKWHTSRKGYALRKKDENGKSYSIWMHREVLEHKLGYPVPDGMVTDHIDGNKLNNTRGNLRLATISQNTIGCKRRFKKTSSYRGVHWNKSHSKLKGRDDMNNIIPFRRKMAGRPVSSVCGRRLGAIPIATESDIEEAWEKLNE